jgi:hypothetical protein
VIKRLIGATVVALCFGGTAVSGAAPPTTTPPAGPVPAPAPTQQPTGLGDDEAMNLYAIACFIGTMEACDTLYNQSPLGSAYETYGDTCAGRRPAGTLPYCTEVFTDTVVQQTSPTTTSPPTTSVVTSTSISAPPVPPTDPDLAGRIPAVDGFSVTEMPADDVLWRPFDDSVPGEFTRHHALVVAADGAPVAHLVVAAATSGDRPAIDTFVEHTFAGGVFLPADSAETDDGVFTTMNAAYPIWTEMEGNAVIVAEQEIDGNFQWGWGANDAVWIVRGTRDAEDYVRSLLRVHAPSLEPFDMQGMTGDLWDYTPSVPGYQYHDLSRTDTLANLSGMGLGDCAERYYAGVVFPDGVAPQSFDSDDLLLTLQKAASGCVEEGVLDDVGADIASGRQAEQIGGLTVYRDEQIISALVGDVLITLYSTNPQTYIDMAPFIEQFFAGQPR